MASAVDKVRSDWQRARVERILLERGGRKLSSFIRAGLKGGIDSVAPIRRVEEESWRKNE